MITHFQLFSSLYTFYTLKFDREYCADSQNQLIECMRCIRCCHRSTLGVLHFCLNALPISQYVQNLPSSIAFLAYNKKIRQHVASETEFFRACVWEYLLIPLAGSRSKSFTHLFFTAFLLYITVNNSTFSQFNAILISIGRQPRANEFYCGGC